MNKQQVPFNESEFEEFLNSDDCNLYQLNVGGLVRKISKIKGNEDCVCLVDLTWINVDNLSQLYFTKNVSLLAFYFPATNSLVFNHMSEYGNLKDICKSLNIYTEYSLKKTILSEIEKEFKEREGYLKECYKNELKELNLSEKDKIWKMAVTGKDERYVYLDEYKFDQLFNYSMVKDYFEKPKQMKADFVDAFLKDPKNKDIIKRNISFEIAKDKMIPDLKENELVKKAIKIHSLLFNELKNAKTLWVKFEDGKREKVENNLYIFADNNIQIGRDISSRYHINNVISLLYKRKEFIL